MTRPIPVALLAALVLAGMLPACTHPAGPDVMATVEQMIQATDSMRAQLDQADTNALRHMDALFQAERPAIEARFHDTLLPHAAEVLGNYHRAMAGRLPRLMVARHAQRTRLDSTRRRLYNLRHDLERGLMNRNRREEALRRERLWNMSLHRQADSIRVRTADLIHDRRIYRSAIDSLLRP